METCIYMLAQKIKKNWKSLAAVAAISLAGAAWAGMDIIYTVTLDFPLYKNGRYWGGSKSAELSSFLVGGMRV